VRSTNGRAAGAAPIARRCERSSSRYAGKSYAGQVPLPPLSRADSLDLLRSVPGRLDEPITEAIIAKADGNPLFLEQLAFDAGEADEGRFTGTVPDTINDVVMARIDRLPDDTKRILQVASVIGRRFSLRLLRAVWQGAPPVELLGRGDWNKPPVSPVIPITVLLGPIQVTHVKLYQGAISRGHWRAI
jgi:hypothetical protein